MRKCVDLKSLAFYFLTAKEGYAGSQGAEGQMPALSKDNYVLKPCM